MKLLFALALVVGLPFCCPTPAFAQAEPGQDAASPDATPPVGADTAPPEVPDPAAPRQDTDTPPPPENEVDRDAEAYTRLVIRHDSLVFKEGNRTLTPVEANEMPGLRASGAAIQAKYAPGGAMAAQAAAYQRRVKELSDTSVAAARRAWTADAFPPADAIVSAYSTDAERRAAMMVLQELLEFKANPLPPAGQEKRTSYMRALDRIMPPNRLDAGLLNATREHTQNPQFRLDVINKFVPAFATEAENVVVKTQYEDDRAFRMNRYWTAYGVTTGFVLLFPFLYVIFGQRRTATPPNPNPAFQLPRKLSNSTIFFRKLGLTYDCGQVVAVDPRAGHTLQTPDGRRVAKRLDSSAAKGDVLGVITSGKETVGWWNHTQGGGRFSGVETRLPINALAWTPFFIMVGLFALINHYLYPTVEDIIPGVNSGLAGTGIFVFLYLYVVVGLLNTKVPDIRDNKLENKWKPQLREFMESREPMLQEIYKQP